MSDERPAPCISDEPQESLHDAPFGGAQAQTRGVFGGPGRQAAVLELAATAARAGIVATGSRDGHGRQIYNRSAGQTVSRRGRPAPMRRLRQ